MLLIFIVFGFVVLLIFAVYCCLCFCLVFVLPVLSLLGIGSVLTLVCWFIVYDLVAVWFGLFVAWRLFCYDFCMLGIKLFVFVDFNCLY